MTTFRDATEADLPAIVALLADDELGRLREDPGPSLPRCYLEGFRAMTSAGGTIILAIEHATVIGCLQLDVLHGVAQLGLRRGHIEAVRVAANRRSHGIGAALLREAIRRAQAAGCGLVQLTTNLDRADARRFYKALGFEQTHAGMKLKLPG